MQGMHRPSASAVASVSKVIAAFLIGMMAMFAGAVLYSTKLHSAWTGVRPTNPATTASVNPPVQTARPAPAQVAVQQRAPVLSTPVSEHQFKPRFVPAPETPIAMSHTDAPPLRAAIDAPAQHPVESHITPEPPPARMQPASYAPEPTAVRPETPDRSLAPATSGAAPAVRGDIEAVARRPEPQILTLQPGTPITVRLAESLSSDRNRTGDTFRATLDSPLVVNGVVIAATGSTIFGRIAQARKAPLIGGRANLTLTLLDITTPDGRLVRVSSSEVEQQGSRSGLVNTAKMTTGAAVGAVVGALTGAAEGAGIRSTLANDTRTNGFMATKRTVVLPAGTQIVFQLAAPATVADRGNS